MRGLLPVLAVLLAGCAGATPARQPTRDRPTIVSLNPCTDAVLAEIAAPGQLLAISHYSKDPSSSSMAPAQAARFPATGGTVEEVLALDPDMVVASDFLAPATRAALGDFGIAVVTVGIASSVEESEAQIQELAEAAGTPGAGRRLTARIERALEAARSDRPAIGALLWQPGGIVAGRRALVSDLLARTGFANEAVRRGLQQADYVALEEVVADPPELLLVAGREQGQRHPVLDDLPQMRLVTLDPGLLYCGGPTIIRAAERLAEIRHTVLAVRPEGERGS